MRNDSIYGSFLTKANYRLSSGETNILEKTTAELQRGSITMQLKQIRKEIEVVLLQFRFILNIRTAVIPEENKLKLHLDLKLDSNLISQHPYLKIMDQQNKISTITHRLEKSLLLPDLQIGYYNMTMKGTGADNKFYTNSSRFQSIQVGIGIPLFFGTQKAKISAARIGKIIAENNYTTEFETFQSQYISLVKQHLTNLEIVNYFETYSLKNATLILDAANKQFSSGELNYLEWVMLANQVIIIQSNYLDAIKNLNETIIQINYLLTK